MDQVTVEELYGSSEVNMLIAMALILGLFFASGPPAVSRLVVPIVIRPAVNRVFDGRFQTHVSQEVRELLPPATDLDAASAIVLVTRSPRVFAAFNHGLPRMILAALSPRPSGVSVFSESLTRKIIVQATTTFRFICIESTYPDDFKFAAIAKAKPTDLSFVSSTCWPLSDEASETFGGYIKHG